MAYPCQIYLKSECDGCGACLEPDAFGHTFNRRRAPVFNDDDFDPFEPDWEEEYYE